MCSSDLARIADASLPIAKLAVDIATQAELNAVAGSIPAAYTDEQARDVIGAAVTPGTALTKAVNDAGDTITLDVPADGLITSPDGVSKSGFWMFRPPPSLPAPSKVITRFASGHGWTGGSDDPTFRLDGVASTYKLVTNGTGGSLYGSSPTFSTPLDLSSSVLRFRIAVDDPTKMLTNQVYVDCGTGNGFVGNLQGNYLANEFSTITLPRSIFTANTGTPLWTNVTGIRLRFQDKSTGAITVHAAEVALLPDCAVRNPSGTLVLEADDGYLNQLSNLRAATDALGVPVTFNPIIERIINGAAGMTAADLRSLHDRSGWQISCHGYAQAIHDTAGLSPAAAEADFLRAKHWLHANGLHDGVDDFALCPGTTTGFLADSNPLMPVIRRNFRSARTVDGKIETNGGADPHRLRSLLFTGQSASSLQTNVDWAAGAGGVFILALHDVLAGSTNGTSNGLPAIAINNLVQVLNYAAAKGMQFRTRGQLIAAGAHP